MLINTLIIIILLGPVQIHCSWFPHFGGKQVNQGSGNSLSDNHDNQLDKLIDKWLGDCDELQKDPLSKLDTIAENLEGVAINQKSGLLSDLEKTLHIEGGGKRTTRTKAKSVPRPRFQPNEKGGLFNSLELNKKPNQNIVHADRKLSDEGLLQLTEFSGSLNGRQGWSELFAQASDLTKQKDATGNAFGRTTVGELAERKPEDSEDAESVDKLALPVCFADNLYHIGAEVYKLTSGGQDQFGVLRTLMSCKSIYDGVAGTWSKESRGACSRTDKSSKRGYIKLLGKAGMTALGHVIKLALKQVPGMNLVIHEVSDMVTQFAYHLLAKLASRFHQCRTNRDGM